MFDMPYKAGISFTTAKAGNVHHTTTSSATDKPSCLPLQTVYDLGFAGCIRLFFILRQEISAVLSKKLLDFSAAF